MGNFYFIKDSYFTDFSDTYLMQNKETVSGVHLGRPCFLSFTDLTTSLNWMIPISSKIEKFRTIYNNKISRYSKCDTIDFGYVLGYEKAFLIQNMCPIIPFYMDDIYIDKKGCPVRISSDFEIRLIKKAKKVLSLQRKRVKLILPDVLKIEKELLTILNT